MVVNGSWENYEQLSDLAESQLGVDRVFDILHNSGVSGHEKEIISPKLAIRLFQNGIDPYSIGGKLRTTLVGYEYEQLCTTHPYFIKEEMNAVSKGVESYFKSIGNLTPAELDGYKVKILENFAKSKTRFYDAELFSEFTGHELLVYLGCSEIQRLLAHIHPCTERVGRTSEETQAVFALRMGVEPLFVSGPYKRNTNQGLERGIVQAIIAIPLLRAVASEMGVQKAFIEQINTVGGLYKIVGESSLAEFIYGNRILRHWINHNVYPEKKVMQKYFLTLHKEVMGLISTMSVQRMTSDVQTLHLAAHLINRGRDLGYYFEN